MKVSWALGNPSDELSKARVSFQRGDGGKVARKLGLGQGGMNLVMADLVKQNGWAILPAFQPWDEVVQALFRVGRDRAVAKGAGRGLLHRNTCVAPDVAA